MPNMPKNAIVVSNDEQAIHMQSHFECVQSCPIASICFERSPQGAKFENSKSQGKGEREPLMNFLSRVALKGPTLVFGLIGIAWFRNTRCRHRALI